MPTFQNMHLIRIRMLTKVSLIAQTDGNQLSSELQQDDVLEQWKETFTCLYGGLIPLVHMAEGGPGLTGQPSKFYAPVLVLPIVDFMSNEEVDALIERHFQTGMSRFEFGQFLIQLGCRVNLTKFGWTLLQKRKQGPQRSEPSTDRRGTTLQLQQISSWRSMYSSEMGDPMPPQLPGGFDQMIPMTMIVHVKKPAFKKPW